MAWSTRELAELAGTTVNTIRHYHHACAAWPKPPSRTGPWLTGDIADLPPTLTVSTTGDVATPHQTASTWPKHSAAAC